MQKVCYEARAVSDNADGYVSGKILQMKKINKAKILLAS